MGRTASGVLASVGKMADKPLLESIIDANGGLAFWQGLDRLEVILSARGALFTLKHRPLMERVRARISVREPRLLFEDFPSPGVNAELLGNTEVRLLDANGLVVASRKNPREAFRGLGKLFRWDDLDFTYFGGYALWNYLVAPYLFLREGVTAAEARPPYPVPGSPRCLKVDFPETIPTHCRTQYFFYDEEFRLTRHDYTAEVVGGWAHAAHLCGEYRTFGGLAAPTRRRVYPIGPGGRVMPWPLLVAIDLHELTPVSSKEPSS